jgi:hypothetical protein
METKGFLSDLLLFLRTPMRTPHMPLGQSTHDAFYALNIFGNQLRWGGTCVSGCGCRGREREEEGASDEDDGEEGVVFSAPPSEMRDVGA